MNLKNLLVSGILLVSPLISSANQVEFKSARDTEISIPENSKLTLNKKDSSKGDKVDLFFDGETSLKGVLQVYWVTEIEEERYLRMRFFPDKTSLSSLPTLKEWGSSYQPKFIDLSPTIEYKQGFSFSESKVKKLLTSQEHLIPENFFRYKERYALIPAIVHINKFFSSGDCSTRHFGATLLDINSFPTDTTIDEMKKTVKDAGGCGQGFIEGYDISSKSGDSVTIKSAPDIYSDTTFNVPNETSIIKIKTINDQWMYVQFAKPGSEEGIFSNPQFGYIHTPDLNLKFTN